MGLAGDAAPTAACFARQPDAQIGLQGNQRLARKQQQHKGNCGLGARDAPTTKHAGDAE